VLEALPVQPVGGGVVTRRVRVRLPGQVVDVHEDRIAGGGPGQPAL
jgi:hypothetical protein